MRMWLKQSKYTKNVSFTVSAKSIAASAAQNCSVSFTVSSKSIAASAAQSCSASFTVA